jgi:hypothetical protein
MVAYVSAPIATHPTERRLYFSCRCGMIAARNENESDGVVDTTPLDSDWQFDEVC